MPSPIFEELNQLYVDVKKTARIEAAIEYRKNREEILEVLKAMKRPTKLVMDLIKKLEGYTDGN